MRISGIFTSRTSMDENISPMVRPLVHLFERGTRKIIIVLYIPKRCTGVHEPAYNYVFFYHQRYMHVIQDQHRKALRASSEEVMDLVSALPADILRLSIMSEETAGEDEDMGVYQDEMD